ncbi:hypothetical protein VNI00_007225 [Paramarasmius palmivorus]|uniref:Lysine-specific metallo-endopeptidase domain-containing protein n=1 Tax=Paramarasmius palmivorus TaxID=297713 RepID=A0AAW0D559_9AGAR
MFRSSFLLLSVLAKTALCLSVGDLDVTLKAVSSSVQSVGDIVVTAIVSNPTESDLRVLAVNNILDTSATRSFDISADGKEVPFTGVKVAPLPSTTPSAPSTTSLPLPPGTKFTIAPRQESTIHASVDDLAPLKVESNAVEVTVESDLSHTPLIAIPEESGVERRVSTPKCSDSGKRQVITDSLKYARSLAGGAATDIRSHPNGPQYTRYFGGNNQNDIWWNLDRVAGDINTNRDITCSQDNGDARSFCNNNPGVIAYTVIYSDGRTPIFTCELFLQAGTTPSICQGSYDSTMSSRGGIILHELAHAVHGADDVTYGCSASAGLSVSDKRGTLITTVAWD